jgi:ribosomal protein S18 acetylase RimI-like enzyme
MVTFRAATPEDAAGIARVQVVTWRHAYKGIVADATLAAMSVERSTANWQRGLSRPESVGLVALVDDAVVGFAVGGLQRDETLPDYDGELYALYVLPQHQGRGIGRELVRQFAAALHEAEYKAMVIWVLKDNVAGRAFYERIGGRYLREKPILIGEQTLQEVAYGWNDLSHYKEVEGQSS